MATTTTTTTSAEKFTVLKNEKFFLVWQISMRALATAATLAAAWIILTNKQTSIVFGIQADANYTYSPAFKFFAYANLIVSASTVLSLFGAYVLGNNNKAGDPIYYFYMFLHDLMVSLFLMSGCAAATAVGYVGKYGNSHAGWLAICGYFEKFCGKATAASSISYFALLLYVILTVVSANKARQIIA